MLSEPAALPASLPKAVVRLVAFLNAHTHPYGGQKLVSATTLRRLSVRGEPGAWIMPAHRDLCVIRTEQIPYRHFALQCVSRAAALTGHLMSAYGEAGAESHIVGILPSGARNATLLGADGTHVSLEVTDNGFSVTAPAPVRITFLRDGREFTAAVPQPATVAP